MKIVSVIAEFNPFHNGHKRQIDFIKRELKPDYTIAFMSGNFTQRGEPSILDKYARARHAILSGYDLVVELPTVFATQNAEIFASGALKLISSIMCENVLCFGAECDNISDFYSVANELLCESDELKAIIKQQLASGVSLIDARDYAFLKLYPNQKHIISSPNNVLGLEYVKAIIKNNYGVTPIVLKRDGSAYNEGLEVNEIPSAFGVRNAVANGNLESVKKGVPPYVFNDLPSSIKSGDKAIIYSLITKDKSEIASTLDCSEGLENRIKEASKKHSKLCDVIDEVKTKRYTISRIKRIILSTALGITKDSVNLALNSELYLKVLAVNGKKTEVFSELAKTGLPLITKKADESNLTPSAKAVYEKDLYSCDLYGLITEKPIKENFMIIV